MGLNAKITLTPIGRRYGWNYLTDVDLDLLENNRAAKMGVIQHPALYPNADIAACEQHVREIDQFMAEYGDVLVEFAPHETSSRH